MSLQHTNINRPGHFTYDLLPCEATWDAKVQVSVDYSETPDENNQVQADAWVRAPGALLKAYILTVNVPAAPERADTENSIIAALKEDKTFAQNMVEYLSMVIDKEDRKKA